MKRTMITKLAVAVSVTVIAFWTWASPLAPVAKTAVEVTEKVGAHAGGHVAGKTAVRGGTALAMATAKHDAARAAARVASGGVVERATPGKILALGGATAMVVGTHEMADGIQTIGESVGVVVKDNPEAAQGVLHEYLAMPKMVVSLVCIAIVVVLGWFFWPVLSLARNMIKLIVARKTRLLSIPSVPSVESGKSDVVQDSSSGFVRLGVIWAVIGFLILTSLGIWRLVFSRPTPNVITPVSFGDKKIDGIRAEYRTDVERIYRAFLAEVDSVSRVGFGRSRACIPSIVENFGMMSRCVSLVKTLVSDNLLGGNRFDAAMTHDLGQFYERLYEARDEVSECVHRLAENLANANRSLAQKLQEEIAVAETSGDKGYKSLLEQYGENVEKSIRDLTEGQIVAGVSVAIEAVCIRETVAVVAKILGKIAARQAGTMAASVGAAAADGPFPVGDIIGGAATVGCTLWTGWDVYQATKILPKRLAETLDNAACNCERKCREEAISVGNAIVSQFIEVTRENTK